MALHVGIGLGTSSACTHAPKTAAWQCGSHLAFTRLGSPSIIIMLMYRWWVYYTTYHQNMLWWCTYSLHQFRDRHRYRCISHQQAAWLEQAAVISSTRGNSYSIVTCGWLWVVVSARKYTHPLKKAATASYQLCIIIAIALHWSSEQMSIELSIKQCPGLNGSKKWMCC